MWWNDNSLRDRIAKAQSSKPTPSDKIRKNIEDEKKRYEENKTIQGKILLKEILDDISDGFDEEENIILKDEARLVSIGLYPTGSIYKTGIIDGFDINEEIIDSITLKGVIQTRHPLYVEYDPNRTLKNVIQTYLKEVRTLPRFPILTPETIPAQKIYNYVLCPQNDDMDELLREF